MARAGAEGPSGAGARRAGGPGGATHLPVREAERPQVEGGGAGLDRQLLDGLHPCRGQEEEGAAGGRGEARAAAAELPRC